MFDLKKDTGLKLWTDASDQYRQVIMGPEKKGLYDRYRRTESFKASHGVSVSVNGWGPWRPIPDDVSYIGKAWCIRDLTIEDLIVGNVESDHG